MADEAQVVNQQTETQSPVDSTTTEGVTEEMVPKSTFLRELEREREKRKAAESYAQQLRTQQTQVQVDETGGFDPNQLISLAEQRAYQRTQATIQEERDWNRAEKLFPELAEDEDIADAVKGYRLNLLTNRGELLTYVEAAEKVLGKFRKKADSARDEGREEAQASETVQKRVGVPTPQNPVKSGDSIIERFKAGQLTKAEIKANWKKISEGV